MLRLAVPVTLASIGVSLSGIADTAVMGRMGEPVYLSATAIGATLFSSLYWAFGFLRMSTGGLVAQAFGARDAPQQRATVLRALALGVAIGGVVLVLQAPLLALGLSAMHDAGGLHALVRDYVVVRIWSAPAVFALFVLHGALVGRQAMAALLFVQLLQTVLNVLLNIAFFAYTDWHVRGVAAATIIADTVAVAVALWLLRGLLWSVPGAGAATSPRLFEPAALRRLFSLSGDLFVRSLCLTGAYFFFTAVGTRLGVTVVAANAILLQLLQFTSFFLDGLAHAAEALVGQAIGRRDRAGLRRAVRSATELSLVAAMLLCGIYALFGGVFVDAMTTDASIRSATREWLIWAVLLPLTGVGSFLLDGIFIGATRTRAMRNGMIVAVLVFIIATQWLVPRFGNHGLWAAFTLMLLVRAAGLAIVLPGVKRAIP